MAPLDGVNDVLDATYGNRADLWMILFFGRIHHGSSHSMNHRHRILFFVVQHMRTSCAILLPALHQGDIAVHGLISACDQLIYNIVAQLAAHAHYTLSGRSSS